MTLPQGWQRSRIGDLCTLINGKAFKPSDWARTGLPIIRIQNLNRLNADFNYCDQEVDQRFLVEPGELLFAWSGTPGTSFGAHVWTGTRAVLNQHIFRVRYEEIVVDRDYFKLAINSTLEELITKAHGGVGLAHVTKGKFEATEVLLPPLAEQRRIVAKLDALTASLSRARAELDRVPVLADRLRIMTLKTAFTGQLTSQMPGGSHTEWEEGTLGDAGRFQLGKMLDKAKNRGTARTYLRNINVRWRSVDLSDLSEMLFEEGEEQTFALQDGDILICEGGEPGRAAVWRGERAGLFFQKALHRIRPAVGMNPHLIVFYLLYLAESGQLSQHFTGSTIKHLPQIRLKAVPFPIIPADVQTELVRLIDAVFARADRMEAEATRARKLLDRLESATLARAFRGELVPQDPADEPAEHLLARIRAERAAAPKVKRGRNAKERTGQSC